MSTNAERFGQIVKARRDELDLNQVEVSDLGGPSNSKLTEIENGRLEQLTRQTARKLDQGLQWEPGSARTTWLGGDPTPVSSRRERLSSAQLIREVNELVRAIDAALEAGATVDEVRAVFDSKTA